MVIPLPLMGENLRFEGLGWGQGTPIYLLSQVAHQVRAYPDFLSMKRLGVFLLPPGWESSPSQGYH